MDKSLPSVSILVGTINASEIRLQIRSADVASHIAKSQDYVTQNYDSFEKILSDFLGDDVEKYPQKCVVASSGTIENNCLKNEALPTSWNLDGNALKETLKVSMFKFISKIQAIGHGILRVDEVNECQLLNPDTAKVEKSQKGEVKAVIELGENLEEAFLAKSPAKNSLYDVYSTLGGLSEYAARSRLQFDYSNFVKESLSKEVCVYDMATSESYIPVWYKFLASKNPELVEKSKEALGTSEPSASAIFDNSEKDELCKAVLNELFDTIATEISNMTWRTLCQSGIYLTGALFRNNSEKFISSKVIKDVLKTKFDVFPVLFEIPIFIVLADDLELRGALEASTR